MVLYMIFVWIAVIIAAVVLEAVTVQFVSIWFVAGGVAGLIANALNVPVWPQVLVASVVTLILLICTRPFVNKKLLMKKVSTNSDRLVGETALVVQEINNMKNQGQVKVKGSIWTARADTQDIVSEGSQVKVLRIEGVKMIVSLQE